MTSSAKLVLEYEGKYHRISALLDDSKLRVDTTVVGVNIHRPTDNSLLWDSWRTLYRHR